MKHTIPTISDLRGLWRRSRIAWPDGKRDTSTSVRWLQGPRAYIDLRQPPDAPDFSAVRCLAHLSMDQCAWLAKQEGFAGQLMSDGACFEWHRSIDYQPDSRQPDAGTLWWEGDVLVETGRDVAYVEHWHRDETVPTLPTCALRLRETETDLAAILLRVGSTFMFARERAVALPVCGRLSQCVEEARSVEAARGLVDCEISFGDAHGTFRISASTLPFRVGDSLGQRFDGDSVITMDRATDGILTARRWQITEKEGQMHALELRP